jgi:hypothetical protein
MHAVKVQRTKLNVCIRQECISVLIFALYMTLASARGPAYDASHVGEQLAM